MSSFGDFIAITGIITPELARYISPLVSDGIIAYNYYPEAVDILRKKKQGKYVMISADHNTQIPDIEFREMYGIVLSQPVNRETIEWIDLDESNIVTKRKDLSISEKQDLMLANLCLKYAQSNNVALALDGQLIGISAGQQSRIHSVRLATHKAQVWLLRNDSDINRYFKPIIQRMNYQDAVNLKMRLIEHLLGYKLTTNEKTMYENKYGINSNVLLSLADLFMDCIDKKRDAISLASDAFFPFRDNIDCASQVGVTAIVQPGGSVRDKDVIEACDEYNISMVCHNKRMFTH